MLSPHSTKPKTAWQTIGTTRTGNGLLIVTSIIVLAFAPVTYLIWSLSSDIYEELSATLLFSWREHRASGSTQMGRLSMLPLHTLVWLPFKMVLIRSIQCLGCYQGLRDLRRQAKLPARRRILTASRGWARIWSYYRACQAVQLDKYWEVQRAIDITS